MSRSTTVNAPKTANVFELLQRSRIEFCSQQMLRERCYVFLPALLSYSTACQHGVPSKLTSVFFMFSLLTSRGLLLENCELLEPRDCWA